jgi:hypothetical protein
MCRPGLSGPVVARRGTVRAARPRRYQFGSSGKLCQVDANRKRAKLSKALDASYNVRVSSVQTFEPTSSDVAISFWKVSMSIELGRNSVKYSLNS